MSYFRFCPVFLIFSFSKTGFSGSSSFWASSLSGGSQSIVPFPFSQEKAIETSCALSGSSEFVSVSKQKSVSEERVAARPAASFTVSIRVYSCWVELMSAFPESSFPAVAPKSVPWVSLRDSADVAGALFSGDTEAGVTASPCGNSCLEPVAGSRCAMVRNSSSS